MVKMKVFVVVLCVIFFSFLNVKTSDGETLKSPLFKPVNIIVILDTSDRISKKKHPGQMERDRYIVEEIVKQFQEVVIGHIDQADNLEYEDRLEVVVPDQPGVDSIPPSIMKKLKIEHPLGREFASLEGASGIFTDLDNQKKVLLDEMPNLFKDVQKHEPHPGSDIWSWFDLEAKDYLLENHQNLIICISDGYLDFEEKIKRGRNKGTYMEVEKYRNKPDWKQKIQSGGGLSPIEEDFSHYDVKFLMLEIALRSERNSDVPYQIDFNIIREYWKTWLKSMGIKDTDFIKQGRPVRRKIESFFK